jgi:hypothetical protein
MRERKREKARDQCDAFGTPSFAVAVRVPCAYYLAPTLRCHCSYPFTLANISPGGFSPVTLPSCAHTVIASLFLYLAHCSQNLAICFGYQRKK